MSHDQLGSLIRMANQIATNNVHYGDEAVSRISLHLQRFWARSMKRQIIDYLEADGSHLTPLARQAVERLKQGQ